MVTRVSTEAETEYAYVGKSVPRVDALEKATGKALYTADLKLSGLLYGKILRSPYAHARILRIDTSKALRLKGVKAVITGEDVPGLFGPAIEDQPAFGTDKVRYWGEPVAAVAATSEAIAEEALSLMEVDYEALPPVLTVEEALQEGAPLVHAHHEHYKREPAAMRFQAGTNLCYFFRLRRGDVAKGFAESAYVFEDTYRSQMVQHAAIEPHVAAAQVDSLGKITVWSPNDAPYRLRKALASLFGLPMTKVRIIGLLSGGGFGGKGGLQGETYAVGLALRTEGHPVLVAYTREESFTATLVRHAVTVRIKTGVSQDGRLLAREVKLYWDTGAYAEKGPTICRQAGLHAAGPYNIPNVAIDSYLLYTNHVVAGALRGYGVPQVAWAHESQNDRIARALGIDPLEFRLKNAWDEGDSAYWGERVFSVGLKESLRKAAEAIAWDQGETAPGRGKGIACMIKATNTPSPSTAMVRVNEDGTATVLSSTMEIGQGMWTVLTQIAAEELGLPLDHVLVVPPDTDVTPYDMSTTSSRSTFHMGNALRAACHDAREQILAIAAEALEANPADLVLREGEVFVKDLPERALTLAQVISHRYGSRGSNILGRGSYLPQGTSGIDLDTGQGARPSTFWMYAAQAAEVAVDPETGRVQLLRMAAAHDVGKAINPEGCLAQIQGGIAMGVGVSCLEELLLDDQGQPTNPSFLDYRLPTSLDVPPMAALVVEAPHPEGPYGAKGVGEPALAAVAPAIANAILDATGVAINDLPLTAERVREALRARGTA